MKLKEGNKALNFRVEDIYGNEIQLSDYKGKKIILSFMRNVSCPFCNFRVHELIGNSLRLQSAEVQVVVLFESAAEKLKGSVFHKGLAPFPLIGDPEKKVYNLYGIENSAIKMMKTFFSGSAYKTLKASKKEGVPRLEDKESSNTLIPADFFIDENFKIVKAHYGNNLNDHVSMDEVREFAGW